MFIIRVLMVSYRPPERLFCLVLVSSFANLHKYLYTIYIYKVYSRYCT